MIQLCSCERGNLRAPRQEISPRSVTNDELELWNSRRRGQVRIGQDRIHVGLLSDSPANIAAVATGRTKLIAEES